MDCGKRVFDEINQTAMRGTAPAKTATPLVQLQLLHQLDAKHCCGNAVIRGKV